MSAEEFKAKRQAMDDMIRETQLAEKEMLRCLSQVEVQWSTTVDVCRAWLEMKSSVPLYGSREEGYVLDLWVGTPPQRVPVLLSMAGSGLTAFACGPQLFEVEKSSTFAFLSCKDCPSSSRTVRSLCSGWSCSYEQRYAQNGSMRGRWFEDVVRLGPSESWSRARMGCHSFEEGDFQRRASGIMQIGAEGDVHRWL